MAGCEGCRCCRSFGLWMESTWDLQGLVHGGGSFPSILNNKLQLIKTRGKITNRFSKACRSRKLNVQNLTIFHDDCVLIASQEKKN